MKLSLGLGLNRQKINSGAAYNTSYVNNLVAQANIDGYTLPSADVLGYLDTMMQALIDNSLDTEMDVLYILATDGDRDFAKYNILNPGTYDCTEIGTPAFTPLQGFERNGGDNGLNTNFNAFTDGVNYVQDDSSYGIYFYEEAVVNGSNQYAMGNGGTDYFVILNSTGANSMYRINSAFNGNTTYRNLGFYQGNRASSTNHNLYLDGSLIDTENDASATLTNNTFKICGDSNGVNAITSGADGHVSLFWLGNNLTAKVSILSDIFNTYMSSL